MAANASWMSLLTSLTWGAGAGAVHAQVRADDPPRRPQLRLVVQTYEAGIERPLGSIQRAVTPSELHDGVSVAVPHAPTDHDTYVVAWVEDGQPDLENEGIDARPRRGSLRGVGRGDDVSIRLSRRA